MSYRETHEYNLRGALKASLACGLFGSAIFLVVLEVGALSGVFFVRHGPIELYGAAGVFFACFLVGLVYTLAFAYYNDI